MFEYQENDLVPCNFDFTVDGQVMNIGTVATMSASLYRGKYLVCILEKEYTFCVLDIATAKVVFKVPLVTDVPAVMRSEHNSKT